MEPAHRHDRTVSSTSSPELLGDYELLSQIAAGEFCTVHRARARHGAAHEIVALKRLRKAHQDAYGRARLLREARAGLTLHGPHLVRVLEVHEQPEPFLVMEYVPGATLRELLVRSSKTDVLPFVAPVLVDVLRALAVLHDHRDGHGQRRPLVHQGPSARHMLVGEDGVTRLLDLAGVHRHGLGSNNVVSQRFLRGELAPEQLEFRVNVDARCDLFIVGKTLGEALARASALRGSRQGEASECARLHDVVARACAERREDRFRSADHMSSALQEAAEEADLFASAQQIAAWVRQCMKDTRFPPLPGQVAAVVAPPPPPRRVPPPPPKVPAPRVPPPPPAPGVARAAAAPDAPVAPAPAPAAPAPTPAVAPIISEPAPVTARLSGVPAYTHGPGARLGSVVGVAGIVALLTSLFTLSVRGLQHTPPTVSAARLAPEPVPAPAAAHAAGGGNLIPMVSPLAAPRKRASPRAAQVERAAPESDFADTPTDISIETIAESIRAAQSRRESANSWVRPRRLRQELPENPY